MSNPGRGVAVLPNDVDPPRQPPLPLYASTQLPGTVSSWSLGGRFEAGNDNDNDNGNGNGNGNDNAAVRVDALLEDTQQVAERRALDFATGIKNRDQRLKLQRQPKAIRFS